MKNIQHHPQLRCDELNQHKIEIQTSTEHYFNLGNEQSFRSSSLSNGKTSWKPITKPNEKWEMYEA